MKDKDKKKRQPGGELPEEQQTPTDIEQAAEPEKTAAEGEPEIPKEDENPLEAQLAAERDRYLRLAAEYDNFRKRSGKERENIYAEVRADTIMRFLPMYDNLERAVKQETADEAYRKGVEMILTGFVEALEKLGITAIPCVGEKFDPALHEAVMHEEDEAKGEGEIVEELQRGFQLGGKVIRFSMVKVAN